MAGGPAPLAAVQAAVMKSAAGAAAQAPASMASAFQDNAIASDLSVMADQAKGYTQGVNLGNNEAASNRSAQAGRLAQEAAQAAQERANSLELQRMDLQAQQARMAADSEAAQRQLSSVDEEDEAAAYAQRRDAVLGFAARNRDLQFGVDLDKIVSNSGSYGEAVALMENLAAQDEITSNQPAMRAYLKQIFLRAAAGKDPNLGALKKDSARPGYVAPERSASTRPETNSAGRRTSAGNNAAQSRQIAVLVSQGVPYQEAVIRVRSGI